MKKSCKKGYYYCFTSKKCKKIPVGYHVMGSGRLMKDSEHEEKEGGEESTETTKNGNGSNGNGGAVSEGWSQKYKKSIDCKNPKGFSQRAHCQGRKVNEQNNDIFHQGNPNPQMRNMPIGQRNVNQLANTHTRPVISGLIHGANQMSQVKKPKLVKSDSVRVAEAKEQEKDHEVSMAKTQVKKSIDNLQKVARVLAKKSDADNLPAWVQAKLTDTEHNTDAAASYMTGKEDLDEGKRDGKSAKDKDYSLHDWFKGGGWVQAGGKYDGKPCAKQPGQKTKPFCRDADDRAAMSKEERNKRAKKKRKEDPNPNRKGKAKIVTAEAYNTAGTRYEKEKNPVNAALADAIKRQKLGGEVLPKMPVKIADSYSNWRGEIELDENALLKLGLGAYASKARNAGQLGEQTKPLDKKYKKQKPGIKDIPTPELDKNLLSDDPIIRRAPKGTASYSDVYYDEETKKDACYKKVKARYDVWPSAYASGALVKCREVGAANWGNTSENYQDYDLRDEYIEENIIRAAKMATKVIKALGKSKVRKSLPPRNLRNLSPERKQEIMYQAQKRIKSYKPGEIDKPASRKYAADRLNTVYSRRQNVIKQGGSPKEAAAQSISSMGPGDALGKDFNIKRGGRGRRGAHGPQTDRGKGNKAARRSGQEVADTGDIDVHYRPTRSQSIQRSRDRRSMRSMERRLNNLLNLNNSYEFSNWRDDFIPTDYETVDLITADPIQVPDSNIQKINERVEYKEGDYVDHPSTREAMKRANKTSLEKLNDRTQEIRNSIKLQAPRNPLTLPSFTTEAKKCWKGYKKAGTQKLFGKTYNRCVKEGYSNWREELAESGYDSTFGRGEMGEPQGTQYPKVNKDKFNKDMEFWRRHLKTAPPVRQASAKKTIQVAHFEPEGEIIEGAAWTRKEGQNKKGGLNEKGRKSYERENPGSDLKAPSKEKGNKRRKSFCARMKGMKKKLTSKKTANDPDSRINKSLRAWNC